MFSRHFRIYASAFVALALAAGGPRVLAAQNLVTNPDFDSSLAGWSTPATVSWDAGLDAGGGAGFGSAKMVFASPTVTGFAPGVDQCVPLTIGTTYRFGGQVLVAPGNTAAGGAFYNLVPYPTADCSGPPPPGPIHGTPQVSAVGAWTSTTATFTNGFAHSVRLGAYLAPTTGGRYQANFDDVLIEPAAVDDACVPDDHTFCFLGSRFRVSATFDTGVGSPRPAHAVPIGNSGYFWFFASDNAEVVVKMLDGCGVGGHYWFFAGGLTNVAVVITVTDTRTGAFRTYVNPSQTAFQPIQDTGAFPCF